MAFSLHNVLILYFISFLWVVDVHTKQPSMAQNDNAHAIKHFPNVHQPNARLTSLPFKQPSNINLLSNTTISSIRPPPRSKNSTKVTATTISLLSMPSSSSSSSSQSSQTPINTNTYVKSSNITLNAAKISMKPSSSSSSMASSMSASSLNNDGISQQHHRFCTNNRAKWSTILSTTWKRVENTLGQHVPSLSKPRSTNRKHERYTK